jgi:hypothetical protein
MDYFVELAVPDVHDAITREQNAGSEEANDLLLYDFLRGEHPTAWVAEVVHAFYANPPFAARVWKNLRYCTASRRKLAAYVITGNVHSALDAKRWL